MKLSMWMIVEKLEKYNPKYDIKDNHACITGIRFLSGEEQIEFQSQYVYLCLEQATQIQPYFPESAVLVNGRDLIILESQNVNDILNDLLAIFDYYNNWEASLWEASTHKSFQQIIDLGNSVLGNPMILSDIDGNVLAMSSAFRDENINEYWIESRNSNHVPNVVLGSPMRTLENENASWTETPQIYLRPDGTKTIGVFLTTNGELQAALGLWEYQNPITQGHIWLVKTLCDVLLSMFDTPETITHLRSSADIIADLLSGTRIDGRLIEKLELRCKSPWQLLVIDNPFRSDMPYKRSLVQRLQNLGVPCIPLIYEDYIVILTSQKDAATLLDSALESREKQYYTISISLPFENLTDLITRYEQALYIFKAVDNKPGVYHGEDYALNYLLSLMNDQNQNQKLLHPALDRLKRYDEEKHGEFYETLYQYLLHERSILLGAQAMHIHRNSFLYRIQRIQTFLNLDLDNPMTRCYLLLSFMLDKC